MHIKRQWIAAILIIVIYFCSYQGGEGSKFLMKVSPLIKNAVNYGLLLSVAVMGTFGLSRQEFEWVKPLWIFVYFIVICIVTVLGIVSIFYPFQNLSFRDMTGFFRLFFTSPVPYGVILFLARAARQIHLTKNR